MSEVIDRQYNESWADRWRRFTGNNPPPSMRSKKGINAGSLTHTISDDAMKAVSQRYLRKKERFE